VLIFFCWVVKTCGLLGTHQCFGETYCVELQGSARGVTIHKNIFTAIRTSNLTWLVILENVENHKINVIYLL
jgi:hypothetical protein